MIKSTTHRPLASLYVAVIGAGASGLVAARELRREGHSVVVFERGDQLGGTWVYTPEVDSDPVGLDPRRTRVHSSIYESLRTNLPREVMSFSDFQFVVQPSDGNGERDPRTYPGHREVLAYLEDFAREFGIESFVRFETEVESVAMVMPETETENQWRVRSKKRGDLVGVDEVFDAVVVCNGHYTEPRLADIPGIDLWPGKQIHSHSYRTPDPFRDQVVVVIGNSTSGIDISRDIAQVSKEVHVAVRSVPEEAIGKQPGYPNMWIHPMIRSAHEDGSVVLEDESVVFPNIILHCTGYKYHFPFLETNGIVTVDDNRVGPLYKHVFPPALAPRLSFVGLLTKTIPFPLFELQSKWIAGVLSNRIKLPSKEEMTEDIAAFYSMLEADGIPKRKTHDLSKYQFVYDDWLAVQCGFSTYEDWWKQMFIKLLKGIIADPDRYRDESYYENLVLQVKQDFKISTN